MICQLTDSSLVHLSCICETFVEFKSQKEAFLNSHVRPQNYVHLCRIACQRKHIKYVPSPIFCPIWGNFRRPVTFYISTGTQEAVFYHISKYPKDC